MTSEPQSAIALDLGGATSSAAILAFAGGRRRLVGSVAMPAGVDPDALIRHLGRKVVRADPDLARSAGLAGGGATSLPRMVARTTPPPVLAVLGATVRSAESAARIAGLAGWAVRIASLEADGPVQLTRTAVAPDVTAVAVTAGEPTSREESAAIADLLAVAAGIAGRGGVRTLLMLGAVGLAQADAESGAAGSPTDWPSDIVTAPAADGGDAPGLGLRRLLDRLDPAGASGRRAMLASIADLAAILDRRVELIEIGYDAGVRAIAGPDGLEGIPAIVPQAALVPPELDDDLVDGVLAWSTQPFDRHRMSDRLRELRIAPWVEAYGEGALLRLAAARAALDRLVGATPDLSSLAAPDLIVVAGGAWSAAPGPAIALAVADVLRRPGASQLAFDHARLLGPLGTNVDPGERRRLLAEVADDLLVPLGSVVIPQGLRAGRSAGRLVVTGSSGSSELDLVPGGLELVDLPPGQMAVADLRFRDPVDFGTRGRRFSVEVGGGLGGLIIDLRDIPLRLPDRSERRRALLETWQAAFWAGLDE